MRLCKLEITPARRMLRAGLIAAAAALLVIAAAGHPTIARAAAAPVASDDLNAEVASLRAQTKAQKAQLDDQQNQIEQLRMMIDAQTVLMRKAGIFDAADQGSRDPTRIQLISDGSTGVAQPASAGASPAGGDSEDRPKSQRAADQLLVEAGGVLLPRWTMQIEPSVDETHVSNPRVNIFGYTIFNAINIGTIRVDDISQDVVNTNLSMRFGLPYRTQFDVRVPFTSAFLTQTKGIGTGNITEARTNGEHIGDVQATLSWQPIVERDWIPAVVLRTRVTIPTGESVFQIPETYIDSGAETQLVRTPTGSGYYSIEPGFTLVWRSDPLVLFAGAAYAYHLKTPDYRVLRTNPFATGTQPRVDTVDHGVLDIGDVVTLNAGLNFAVNERASINFSFVDLYQNYTRQFVPTRTDPKSGAVTPAHWNKLLGTTVNDARLGLGASFGLTNNVALVLNAGMGLTDQSPGYTFSLSVPITLPLHR